MITMHELMLDFVVVIGPALANSTASGADTENNRKAARAHSLFLMIFTLPHEAVLASTQLTPARSPSQCASSVHFFGAFPN